MKSLLQTITKAGLALAVGAAILTSAESAKAYSTPWPGLPIRYLEMIEGFAVVTFDQALDGDKACGSAQQNKIALDLSTATGRAALSLMQSAFLSQRRVYIASNGQCLANGLAEGPGHIAIDRDWHF